jgi:predicted acyltransferase
MGTFDKPASASSSRRLVSVDALRGFDMFWIVGGEEFARALVDWGARYIPALNDWNGWSIKDTVHEQLEHVDWAGFHFYDLIFPLFLFVVGVVLPFSLGKLQERDEPRSRIYGRIFRRTILLFFLGLVYYGFLRLDFANQRLVGVLQRIAICYFFAAVVMLNTRVRGQVIITLALLLGYWALLAFVAPPDGTARDYTKEQNLSGWVDRHFLHDVLGSKIFDAYYKYGDNEGLLSTIPAIATALLGVVAGQWLRSGRSPWAKFFGLLLAGCVCLAIGYAWGGTTVPGTDIQPVKEPWVFPIIKNIWTSSFVLVAGGWSLLLLALFYGIIDGIGWKAWAFPFVVIGMNAITIYVGAAIVQFPHISDFFFGGLANRLNGLSDGSGEVLLTAGTLVIEWLVLLHLYRHKVFLRV